VVSFACAAVIYYSANYYADKNDYKFLKFVKHEHQIVLDGVDYSLLSASDTASFPETSYIEDCVLSLDLYDKSVL